MPHSQQIDVPYNQRVVKIEHREQALLNAPVWRAIEFFAGIGGFACAWPECDIALAIDINADARRTYELNWPHAYRTCEIESLEAAWLTALNANLWWMSPPCQPYSRRGHRRDVEDPRAASLLHLLSLLPIVRPHAVALENVVGFADSRAHSMLENQLKASGYHVMTRELCPTQFGWPNRRPRFYLLASQTPLAPWRPVPRTDNALPELLAQVDSDVDHDACSVDQSDIERFGMAMDRVSKSDASAVTACFGSSYGKSHLQAGSYLVQERKWRRFAPAEVACLLGFPKWFKLPPELSYRRCWKLLGNSLSIPAVRYVLSHLPNGPR